MMPDMEQCSERNVLAKLCAGRREFVGAAAAPKSLLMPLWSRRAMELSTSKQVLCHGTAANPFFQNGTPLLVFWPSCIPHIVPITKNNAEKYRDGTGGMCQQSPSTADAALRLLGRTAVFAGGRRIMPVSVNVGIKA